MKKNILISGTGGQGIVASGEFLSTALFQQGYEVIFGRSYGSEARGGSCRSEIMVSDTEIHDLQFENSDLLLCLSLPAYKKYIGKSKQRSIVIVDSNVLERLEETPRKDVEIIAVPAREHAIELGNQIVANMVMLGALAKREETVSLDQLKDAVESNMRVSMRAINIKALDVGYSFL